MANNFENLYNGLNLRPQAADPTNPKDGDLFYSDGTARAKGIWQYKDGTWATVGGGSGSLDTIFQLIAQEQLSTWSTGNNATFLGGGVLAGSFVKETVTPLAGLESYKFTQAAGSLNDYLSSDAQPVDKRFRGKECTLFFPALYNGANNDIEVVFYDDTNLAVIPSSVFIQNSPIISIFKANITIPSTCESIRVGFKVSVLNSGKILEFDDVQLTSDTTVYADIANQSQSGHLSNTATFTNTTVTGVLTRSNGEGLFTYNSGTGLYTFLKRSKVTISYSGRFAATSCKVSIQRNLAEVAAGSQSSGGLDVTTSYSEILDAGDTIRCFAGGSVSFNLISISAIASNRNILTAPETFSTDTAALTYVAGITDVATTLAALVNKPIGSFSTFTYAASTNTRSITVTAPTQTTADMNQNGIQIFGRGYTATSNAASPTAVAIQIGKGLKGVALNLYKSVGKVTSGAIDHFFVQPANTERGLSFKEYNEVTGILILDAGFNITQATTHEFTFTDPSAATSGYLVINASKNSALTGLNVDRVAARAVQSSGQNMPNSTVTTLIYDTSKTFDTHNALNTSTGEFTTPVTGDYQINAEVTASNTTWTSGQLFELILRVNGTVVKSQVTGVAGGTYTPSTTTSDVLYLFKGDILTVAVNHNRGAAFPLITNNTRNVVSITKTSVG